MPDFDFSNVIRAHIHRQRELHFDMNLTRDLIKVAGPFKEAYLNCIQRVKLMDKETAFQHSDILDRIELTNIILDEAPIERTPSSHLINTIYFTCLLKNTSLFFFRSRHLLRVLTCLTELRPGERDFWIKTEDYVLRVKTQYSIEEICQIIKIYSRVNPSHLFWMEIEQLLLAKSSDFRSGSKAPLLIELCQNMQQRHNETFWRVFSRHL